MCAQIRPVKVGTRGSPLALVQTEMIVRQLRTLHPEQEFVVGLQSFVTEGDRTQAQNVPLASLAGRGVFVKDLEQALLTGAVDFAVHSLKDMTTDMESGLILAAVSEREDPRDVLVSRHGVSLMELPPNARVGTSSPRRAAQLSALRSDLRFEPIRGNVDTRVRKVDEGEYDATVLAAAGLLRLGQGHRITEYFSTDVCLPDPGQGALAIECRGDDDFVREIMASLNHQPTWQAVAAERALLHALGGGCQVPIAAYGEVDGSQLTLKGLVASDDYRDLVRGSLSGPAQDAERLGRALADQLRMQGADRILRAL